ncbi:MAG: DNA-deoxyinosine glycosylase [Pseudomonadota bacterium]
MTRVQSFSPIADKNARILILGSMPGRASLAAHRYYAHPQNSFWRIMAQLLQMDPEASYEQRIKFVKSAGIAVWDVLQSCIREGSLDAKIERDSLIANDFPSFFQTHKKITHVFFNGAKAETCFKQNVVPLINHMDLTFRRLPSTSPANAATTFAHKLQEWREILPPLKASNIQLQ